MVLTHSQARSFYDRIGKLQDSQAFYEDAALDALVTHSAFEHAQSVFELGCGTGRFASRLLMEGLPQSASYLGIDLSTTMIGIAEQRITPFAKRARVDLSNGALSFPLPDHSVDRVVSTYVLDLLPEAEIRQAVTEALRVLTRNGKLCLASLTKGKTVASRAVSGIWAAVFRLYAPLTGGCRPILLESFIDKRLWSVEYRKVIIQFGVPSEVLIVSPKQTTVTRSSEIRPPGPSSSEQDSSGIQGDHPPGRSAD